jgi:hypothetical protein
MPTRKGPVLRRTLRNSYTTRLHLPLRRLPADKLLRAYRRICRFGLIRRILPLWENRQNG